MSNGSRQEVAAGKVSTETPESTAKESGMLVLTRKPGEWVYLDGGRVKVCVVSSECGSVRLGFEAPPECRIDREEVHFKRERERIDAGA